MSVHKDSYCSCQKRAPVAKLMNCRRAEEKEFKVFFSRKIPENGFFLISPVANTCEVVFNLW